MDELCVTRTMSLFQWIDKAATLGVDGLEMYPGFFASFEENYPGASSCSVAAPSSADAHALRLARLYATVAGGSACRD